ncbi:energy transducer TonB [Sphingomonas sp. IC-11]|uniref:energy transducer TonB n=1 Tax=Sphingomonas sp. IC-11 TaxID=2898528 RepID=UPI001E5D21C7|nr:energy transducer TonB [Sphingomonas sp. IC-11]MCD2316475.1 energy transducer TonB [Sphingomonas sp. IC-11]
MYANNSVRSGGVNAGSLVAAVAINAAVIGALILSAPVMEAITQRTGLRIENIPLEPPPQPPEVTPPKANPAAESRLSNPPEQLNVSSSLSTEASEFYVIPTLPLPSLPAVQPASEVARVDPPAPPVMVEARVDPRYARDLQPTYPAGERRAEREGSATIRVTIGASGRVVAAECVSATSDAFCRATREHALAKWRFQPATRDGVPTEATREMTVRFELES